MLLVLLFAILALIVLAIVCRPLMFGVRVPTERRSFDSVVYRDQLGEVQRDVARGVLSQEEAATARLEIQRRLLAADAINAGTTLWSERTPRVAMLAALLLLGGASAVYWRLGAPALPDAPYAARPAPSAAATTADPAHLDMRDAADRLREKLKADPSNPQGWVLYARTQSMLGDWHKAADAYHRAIDLGEKSADVQAGLGEMLVLSMDGIVAPAAHDAFTAALAMDPHNDVARYYLALAQAQAGEGKQAIDSWLQLAADIPEDSPMREEITRRIVAAAKDSNVAAPVLPKGTTPPPPPSAAGGPDKDQMEAAAQMPEAERNKMIRGMVAQLAVRLQTQPDDLDGWMRLGRAYAVLGEPDKATDAYEHAIKLKPDNVDIRLQAIGTLLGGLQPSDPLPPRAVALLREVQLAAPNQPEVLWYLGVVAARDGHPDEARADWTRLLAALPSDGEDAKLVKTALEALDKRP